MTVAQDAPATARRLARATPLTVLTRAGFVGYALIHLLLAWITAEIALGRPAEEGDQSGAFQVVARQPMGAALLVATAVGLAAMTGWQLLAAAVGHRDLHGARRSAERVLSVARAAIYAGLAWTAARTVAGASTSTAQRQHGLTARLMAATGGRWLVAFAGIAVVGISCCLIWYGLTRQFLRHLDLGRLPAPVRRAAGGLGAAGYAAKGLGYAVAGILLVVAAVTTDPGASRGLDAALRTLATRPFGDVLLAVVAVGFAAFGGYCLVQARCRRI